MKILMVKMAGGIGGAEVYSQNLVEGLKKYYPETEIFFLTNLPDFAHRLKKAGGEVFTLPIFHEEVGTKRGLGRLILALPKYLAFFIPKILYLKFKKGVKLALFQGTTEKIVLTPLLKLLKFKVIWLEHGPMFAFRRAKLVLWLYRLNAKLADKIIAVSENSREDLIRGGIAEGKVICLHTGIGTDYFVPDHRRLQGTLTVGFLGSVCWEKGIKEFLLVASSLVKKFKGLRGLKFLVVGGGSELDWGKECVKRQQLDKYFEFTGFIQDTRPYVKKFELFYFPTRHIEGLSLAILEAMAMGIPVVARDIGGNKELVEDGKTGYLFRNERSEKIAEILIGLLQNKKKREDMGRLARVKVVKEFNSVNWINKWQKNFSDYQ